MLKKSLLLIALALILPVYADYQPLSDEPINSPEEFEQMQNTENETEESPEFEYPAAEVPEPVEVKPTKNYAEIYNNLQPADFSYQHDMDPEQYYDIKDASWSPYPLLRLNSYIYFKNIAIEPGYYLLTPREHEGKWYILFKQNLLLCTGVQLSNAFCISSLSIHMSSADFKNRLCSLAIM